MSETSGPASETRIGKYEIIGHLAAGGMAEILLARLVGPRGIERPVVVKRILPHLARQKGFVDMFLDEARIVANIRHPNVVHVTELGHDGDDLYLVMEYIDGESVASLLRRLVARGMTLDYDLAAFIVAEACAGLHAAHELRDEHGNLRDVVHRDVSPQNVILTYEGHVKVIDFGIATGADRVTRTETGLFKGKLEYSSPEHCLGMELDRRADVFALGILLYELTTATRLFRRLGQLDILHAICEAPIRKPSAIRPDYPPELEAILRHALHRDRDGRYPSAAAMRRDLLRAMRHLSHDVAHEQRLGLLMRSLFAERAEKKRLLLGGAEKEGTLVMSFPSMQSDPEIDLPTFVDTTPDSQALEIDDPGRGRVFDAVRDHALAVGVGVGLFLLTAGGLALKNRLLKEPGPAAPPSSSEVASAAPSGSAPAREGNVTIAVAAREVTIHVESSPANVHVFLDGTPRGTTPLDLKLARGDTAKTLELREPGFVTMREQVVPNRDLKLKLSLSPEPRGSKNPYRRF